MHSPSDSLRFWSKVDVSDGDGACWRWTAAFFSTGYGEFRIGKTMIGAHRFAYEDLVGQIPEGLQLDHLCRVIACVNPLHLEPVTARVNLLRGNTFQARNARKVRCPNGHPYDMVHPNGGRGCRQCHLAAHARRERARRARIRQQKEAVR